MKKFAVAALLGALAFPLAAEAAAPGAWAGYVTYAPKPVVSTVSLQEKDLAWLGDVARLIGDDGFTFLGRRDDDHWVALINQGTTWVLEIHDTSARFNFRATVRPKSGRISVEKGVDWVGSTRQADADRSSRLAVGYVNRARMAADLFPEPAMMAKPMAKPPMTTAPMSAKPMSTMPMAKQSAAMTPTATPMDVPAMPPADQPMADPMMGSGGADAWQKLVDGNMRFVSGQVTHPNQSMARVAETAMAQKPFAIVVACSDSQVPPEVLFDQGIGDLYVIRTAGEVVTDVELGSIEYAVSQLGVNYLVVLGHKRCAAVQTTLQGGDLPPNIEAVAAQIRPAVEAARFFKGDLLDNAVRENAKMVLAKIQGSPNLAAAIRDGKLNLKAAYYDVDTGKVAALP